MASEVGTVSFRSGMAPGRWTMVQGEAISKIGTWKEIIKIKAKIPKQTLKEQRLCETKSWFFEKVNKIDREDSN